MSRANSPNEAPPHASAVASPYLEQFNTISSPVPDFAATLLSTPPEHEIEAEIPITIEMEGTSASARSPSLRNRVPISSSSSLNRIHPSRQPYLTENEFRHFTSESRRRMQRNTNTELSRHATAAAAATAGASSYADRDTHRQSLYDWAATEDSEDSEAEDPLLPNETDGDGWRDLEEALSTHRRRRNQSRPSPEVGSAEWMEAEVARRQWVMRAEEMARGQRREREERRREERILSLIDGGQSMRLRHRASRERILRAMEGFMAERERRNGYLSRGEPRDSSTGSTMTYGEAERRMREIGEAERRDLERSYGTRLHRSERAGEVVKESQRYSSVRVRNMVDYLSRVRECDLANHDVTVALATELDVVRNVESDDIVTETKSILPPPWTSLLTPGSTFTGSQHAPHDASGAHLLSRDRDYLRRMVANRNLSSAHLPGSIATLADAERYLLDHPSTSHYTSTITSRSQNRAPDHWPVSVTLHSVDMENLTVTGTMSANHIPDKFSPTSPDHKPDGSSMKSYFEGEIIDMNKFTLETETYKKEGVAVDIETDVEYWKQLGPFREEVEKATQGVTKPVDAHFKADVQLAACLGSLQWVKKVIGSEWILMRWKERCFLPPSDSNSWGLTISGFYYIALKRDTGRIEGLYYDPGSQPYQRLDLVPDSSRSVRTSEDPDQTMLEAGGVRKWFPSVEFGHEGYTCAA